METHYLIDFENVNNSGIENMDALTNNDHVHIFSTKNAINIRMDIFAKGLDINVHVVPVRKQSLDMHLVSHLGYLLGSCMDKTDAFVIVSNDKDYDNIIQYWKDNGYQNISRIQKLPVAKKKQQTQPMQKTAQTVNSKISTGMSYDLSGQDRSDLNIFMQHGLMSMGYSHDRANRVCKLVVAHCNDERMLSEIHNDLKKSQFPDYSKVYEDVKQILEKFATTKSKPAKKENQVRSFFGQHFRKKVYVDNKEEIINIITTGKTKQQINNGLLKLLKDGNVVKAIFQKMDPIIKDLPGK